MRRARLDARERIRHAETDVVMRVHADFANELGKRRARDARDFTRQTTAVRVAQHDHVRARLLRRLPGRNGILLIQLVAIEAMLRVVDDELPVVFQELHGVTDHAEIFVRRAAQDFLHMQHGSLAEDRHDRRLGFEQEADLIVLLHRHALAPRRTESRELRVLKFLPLRLREELDVLGIAPRPAALDEVNAEGVNPFRNADFVRDGKVDAFTLRAIAQSRVIDFDFWFHSIPFNGSGLLRHAAGRGKMIQGRENRLTTDGHG